RPVADEIPVAGQPPMAMEEAKARYKRVRIDELHDRVEVVEAVLERRPREDEREARRESLDDAACLRLPILDPLPLVEDHEVPARSLDVEDVPENLLVIANGEERIARVALRTVLRRADHDLRAAVREAPNLAPPLRLERGGADNEHPAHVRLARQELRDADPLDR